MKVLRWGVCALAALLMTVGSSFASESNGSELEAMKVAMDNMKQEFDTMRAANMSAEREAMRESAGGAPEALRSKGGNATVRIGGAVVVRYDLSLRSNENGGTDAVHNPGTYGGGEYSNQNGWKMDTAKVTFDFQITEDLSAFIDVRPSDFDKAYFQWANIGGTGLTAQIGYIGIPGGMYSADWAPCGDVLILNPATKEPADLFGAGGSAPAGISDQDDLTAMGVKLWYELDQFKVTGTVYNSPYISGGNWGTWDGFSGNEAINYNGEIRNGGIDHSLMLEFNPAFIEGLHFAFTYVGQIDSAEGYYNNADTAAPNTNGIVAAPGYGGTAYSPRFDLGAAYVGDKFSAWVTGDYRLNPMFLSDTSEFGVSIGANYKITDRFAVGASFDFAYLCSGNDILKRAAGATSLGTFLGLNANELTSYDYELMGGRVQIGAKYTLCNGVWFKANYGHGLYGNNNQHRSHVRSFDRVIFETGVAF